MNLKKTHGGCELETVKATSCSVQTIRFTLIGLVVAGSMLPPPPQHFDYFMCAAGIRSLQRACGEVGATQVHNHNFNVTLSSATVQANETPPHSASHILPPFLSLPVFRPPIQQHQGLVWLPAVCDQTRPRSEY